MIFRYFFTIFFILSFLFANDDIGLDIESELLDLNKSQKISKLDINGSFYYHISILDSDKKSYKNIKFYSFIPDDIKLISSDLKKFGCSYKSNKLICTKDSIKDRVDLFIKAKISKAISNDITTTFFLELDGKLISTDTTLLNIEDIKKFNGLNKSRDLNLLISNQNPKVNDIVELNISSSNKRDFLFSFDKKLKFISSDICKKRGRYIECNINSSKKGYIKLKAISYGFSINSIIDRDSKKVIKDILFDIKRAYIPKLNFTFSSNDEVISGTDYQYIVDINSSSLKQNVKDFELSIKTLSEDNFKFLKVSPLSWECKQRGKFLKCRTKELKDSKNSRVLIDVKAPEFSTSIKTRAILSPNGNKELVDLDLDVINFDFDMDNTKEFNLEKEFHGKFKLYKTFSNLFKIDSRYSDISSKIFLKKKLISTAKLDLDSDDEVVYAKLIWMAKVDKNIDYEKLKVANRVKFRSTKDSSFKNLEAKLSNFNFKSDDDFLYYSSYIDVTNYIKKFKSGLYELKDIVCSDGFGAYGSWGLIVVVKNKKQKVSKDIRLYYGFDGVYKSEYFSQSRYFLDSWSIDFDLQNRLDTQISLYILGGDKQFQDRGVIKDSSGDILYDKNNIARSFTNVDIKIGGSEKSISNLELYSKGDKFFVGFISTIQEQTR